MRDALTEVKQFSNDNNELDESLIGLLRTTAITVNVAKRFSLEKRFNNSLKNLKK